ncbi:hypothetical protein SS50377_25606 [Spironucleus salmonicida]|uniref:Uncharacterized protein n=1 Tax=Spironucleus salmonicida TaxID=348837 RepID=A0A9P8LNL7_9EUKA|nr:hypothetical protein SS50377_25606 [Spironucleus salmonicida]
MTEDLFVEFEAIPFSVDANKNVIVSNTILQIKFTIRDNEISQSIQLDGQQQYILRATITTKEQLCAVQVVLLYKKLGKIAQNMRFQISQLKKIIKSRDPKFWDNIGLVAAQMGLRVLSIKCTCDYYFAKFAQSIEGYDLQYFSLYNSFDTEQLLQPEVIEDLNFHENQVLLQLAAIKYQKVGEYHLILPLIFGYSAFRLYDTQFKKLKKNTITRDVYGEDLDLLKKIFEVSNKIYKGESFTEQEKPQLDEFELINLFQLPFHFLDTGICLFMFQQLCHVSYLFKAEYFALFSLVKNDLNDTLTNAVISQSSRSGKSVALYTQYFFHLLIGNVPILFNRDPNKDQPLYKYYTENFHSSLAQQYIDVYNLSEIKKISKVKNLKEDKELKEVEDLNKQKDSKEVEDLKKDKDFNNTILQSVCNFHQFQLTSLGKVSHLFYKMVIFIENIKDIKDIKNDKGDATFDLLDTVKNLQYNNHIFTKFELFENQNFFIYKKDDDTSGILDDQILERSKKQAQHQTPIILVDECLQSQKSKFPKCVKLCQMIFMRYEEKLIQLGKKQYREIQTTLDSDEFKAITTFAAIEYKEHDLAINVILPLLSKELLELAKTELGKISMTDRFQNKGIDLYQTLENIITSVQSQNADQKFYTIHGNQEIIVEYLKSLNSLLGKSEYILIAMEYLRLEIDDYDLLDELVVHSPQILNIRNRTQFREIFFSGMVSYRNRGQYYEDFETNFYKLILSLFNPRGVETAFWKTFSIIAMIAVKLDAITLRPKDIIANTVISIQFVMEKFWKYSVKELIQEYFGVSKSPDLEEDQRKEQQVDNFISMFHEEHKPLLESLQKTFDTTKLLFVPNVEQSTVIMVGTDLTVINFLTVNQFCYNAMSSRANMGYINTQILGYVQPHASLLSSLQYEQRRMVVDATGYTNSVGAIADTVKTFAEETPILISLLYSMMTEKSVEMQFMCSSVCPSIWFLKDKESKQLNNFNAVKRHQITVNNVKSDVYQLCSLTQTFENIIISKDVRDSANFVLTKGTYKFNLLNNESNYNISCIASTTLNSEVVAVLNYQLMKKFIETFSQNIFKAEKIQSLSQDLSKFFSRSILLEFLNVILLVMIISRQSNTLLENLKKVIQTLNRGSVYVQAIVNNKIKITFYQNLVEAFAQDNQKIMFLNPTLDYALHEFSDNNRAYDHKGEDAAVYNQILKDSVQAACEAFEILVRQEKIASLIIIIPFDKKMCFQPVLDQDHKIFDFIITFHGYSCSGLSLDMIEGCYVLPVECGHYIPDFLNQKIMPFGLKNVLQIGLDSKTADLIFEYTGEENDHEKFYMSASALVTQEQEKENAKRVERIKKIFDLADKSRQYQFYQLTQEDEYSTIFDSFIQSKHKFSIANHLGNIYIFIKKPEGLNTETSLPNLTGMVSVEPVQELNFFNQVFDSRQKVFCCDKFQLTQTHQTVLMLDLRLIKDPSVVVGKLYDLFNILSIKDNFTEFQFIFKQLTDISQLLDQMQLSVVFQWQCNNQIIFSVKNTTSFDIHQEPIQKPLISKIDIIQDLVQLNIDNFNQYFNKQGYIYSLTNAMIEDIVKLKQSEQLQWKYAKQKKIQLTDYNRLLEEFDDYRCIIIAVTSNIIILKNNYKVADLIQVNSARQRSIELKDIDYLNYLKKFATYNQDEQFYKYLISKPIYTNFIDVEQLQQKEGEVFGVSISVVEGSLGTLTAEQQLSFASDQFLVLGSEKQNATQIQKLFVALNIIVVGIAEGVVQIVILQQ